MVPSTKVDTSDAKNNDDDPTDQAKGKTTSGFEVSAAAKEALEEEKLFQDQGPGQRILEKYMKSVIENGGGTPLPILNRIHTGYLPLVNYNFDEANAFSFTQILQ